MMSKKSSIVITVLVTLVSFFTVMWVSCGKASNPPSCLGVVCENGGYCYMDTVTLSSGKKVLPACACPGGFEGPFCATASVNKYLGTWDVKQLVWWSDSTAYDSTISNYAVVLEKTATNTTFFINNFFNNVYYNNIICDIDSATTSTFIIDTTSDFHEFYNHYQVKWGVGTIYGVDSINITMFIRFKNGTSNWQQDSIMLHLTPHHF